MIAGPLSRPLLRPMCTGGKSVVLPVMKPPGATPERTFTDARAGADPNGTSSWAPLPSFTVVLPGAIPTRLENVPTGSPCTRRGGAEVSLVMLTKAVASPAARTTLTPSESARVRTGAPSLLSRGEPGEAYNHGGLKGSTQRLSQSTTLRCPDRGDTGWLHA
jgi:hypothetical protein